MAEWLKAPSWKGGGGNTPVGSNLTSSSISSEVFSNKKHFNSFCIGGSSNEEVWSVSGQGYGCLWRISEFYWRPYYLIKWRRMAPKGAHIGESHSGDCTGLQNRRRPTIVGSSPTSPANEKCVNLFQGLLVN